MKWNQRYDFLKKFLLFFFKIDEAQNNRESIRFAAR